MPVSFVSHLGFGCAALTGEPTSGSARRLLETAYDAGIRHFDTAPGYGAGYSERVLGAFLKGKREGITVVTKIGSGRPASSLPSCLALPLNRVRRWLLGKPALAVRNPSPPLLTPRRIPRTLVEASVMQSLRSLRTDYIDVLLLHEGLPSFLETAAYDYLRTLQSSGVVGSLGVAAHGSNYLPLQPVELEGWHVLQYEYGAEWPRHRELSTRFPSKRHIFHSCLGAGCSTRLNPGAHLAGILRAAPGATVLFFSRQPAHIRSNIRDGEAAWRAAF